jgi:uncharacterized repeat protein (TIGR01451 family)
MRLDFLRLFFNLLTKKTTCQFFKESSDKSIPIVVCISTVKEKTITNLIQDWRKSKFLDHPMQISPNMKGFLPTFSDHVVSNCTRTLSKNLLLCCLFTLTSQISFGQADLSISKRVDQSAAIIGDSVTFTVTVYNQGKTDVNSVTVQDITPAGLSNVTIVAPAGTTYASGVWTIGTILAATDSLVLTMGGNISGDGVIYNRAEIATMSPTDLDSSPGNGALNEDDIASACVSSPVYLPCSGGSLTLTAPSGHSAYQWYDGTNPIASATDSILVVTEAGDYTYSLSINGSNCPASLCCPVSVRRSFCLGNVVWIDTDNNGSKGSGEVGVDNVEAVLYNVGGDGQPGTGDDFLVATDTTSGSGFMVLTTCLLEIITLY